MAEPPDWRLPTCVIVLAILMLAPVRVALADSPAPTDDSSFAAQISVDPVAGAILTVPPFFRNTGAIDHRAEADTYPTNASAGSIDGNPANASASLAQGAVDHRTDADAYPTNASAGSINGNPANASASLAQGAVDHRTEADAFLPNGATGALDGHLANASDALAQGALDYTAEANMIVFDPIAGSIVSGPPNSSYVAKVTPTLTFWGALVLTVLLLIGLAVLFRRRGPLQEAC
jgi:hypothetical protein